MLVLLSLTAARAGALGPGIPVAQVVPPPVLLEGVNTIDVVPFTGPQGEAIALDIEAAMARTDRIVEANGMAQVGTELVGMATETGAALASNLVGGGVQGKLVGGAAKLAGGLVESELEVEPVVIDDGLSTSVFQLVDGAADAVIAGEVTVDDALKKSKKTVTVLDSDGHPVKDSDGNTVTKEIPCTTRVVTVGLRWRVEGGGEMLHQGANQRKARDSKCGDERDQLATKQALASPLLEGWGEPIAATVSPGWAHRRVPLVKNKAQKEELKLVRGEALDLAACGYRALLAFDDTDRDARLNLGALLEARGYLPEAMAEYQVAMGQKSDRKVTKAMGRVTTRQAEVGKLEQAYGLSYTVGEPDLSVCPPVPEGRRTYVKKAAELLDGPGGAVLGELGKGWKVFVVEEGDFAKVITVDGREGYLDTKRLK